MYVFLSSKFNSLEIFYCVVVFPDTKRYAHFMGFSCTIKQNINCFFVVFFVFFILIMAYWQTPVTTDTHIVW